MIEWQTTIVLKQWQTQYDKPIGETNNTYHYPVRYILLVSGIAAAAEKVIYCKKSGSIYGSCSGIEVH